MINNEATSILHTGSVNAIRVQYTLDTNELFTLPRLEGEFDMVGAVRQILTNNNLDINSFNSAQIIQDAAPLRPQAQRFLLNRYWRIQMLSVREDNSLEERSCLIDSGEYADWIRLFTESIVPFLTKHSLPKTLF